MKPADIWTTYPDHTSRLDGTKLEQYLTEEAERRSAFESTVLERLAKLELKTSSTENVEVIDGYREAPDGTKYEAGRLMLRWMEPSLPMDPASAGTEAPLVHLGIRDSLERFGTGHPSEEPCIKCELPTFDILDRYGAADGSPLCSKACFDRALAAPVGVYVGDGHPAVRRAFERIDAVVDRATGRAFDHLVTPVSYEPTEETDEP